MIQTDLFGNIPKDENPNYWLLQFKLPKPNTQLTEVLYYLIKRDKITFSQIYSETKIINLSARLSDLRKKHGFFIPCKEIKYTNKFGRKADYGTQKLTDKQKGIEVYLKLVASKKQKTQ